ncbi:MAG: response regulator [Myxococcota bacterium]
MEDDRADALLIQRALKKSRYNVALTIKTDGVDGMNYLNQAVTANEMPDLILLDLNMPRKDGLEVLQELKSDPRFSTVPVVILTTSDASRDIHRAYKNHANSYVQKPFSLAAYMKAVEDLGRYWFGTATLP